MEVKRIYELISRELSNEITAEERIKLNQIAALQPEIAAVLALFRQHWASPHQEEAAKQRLLRHLNRLKEKGLL
ncbi:hypothetical protein [Chitinophaga vietnamensis]|uniref:hypothetical protein n=1 Tax=Chitinophaga vietnamensis TaxID=2593957 RepID=UPI001177CF69|nr:hypothetical protein [Chitinophaga vietnamensis]